MTDEATTGLTETQQAFVAGLRQVADFLADKPELVRAVARSTTFYAWTFDKPTFARLALMLGDAEKSSDTDYYNVERSFGPLTLQVTARHEHVCERVVVGVETVEVTAPDPEAVAALPRVTRTETVEKVEWVCPPSLHELLSDDAR